MLTKFLQANKGVFRHFFLKMLTKKSRFQAKKGVFGPFLLKMLTNKLLFSARVHPSKFVNLAPKSPFKKFWGLSSKNEWLKIVVPKGNTSGND